MRNDFTRQARGVLAAVVGVGVAAAIFCLPACTSVIYDSNPEGVPLPADEEPDFASRTVLNLMAESLAWVSERHPPPDDENNGWFAINLPKGVTAEQYIDVATRIGDRATPITPESESLPTYHIGWVWMRGDQARVDVFRPVYAFERSGGQVVQQAITLHLKRRFSSWRVEQTQPWDPGVVDVPPIYYMPEPETTDGEAGLQEQPLPEDMEPEPTDRPDPETLLQDADQQV